MHVRIHRPWRYKMKQIPHQNARGAQSLEKELRGSTVQHLFLEPGTLSNLKIFKKCVFRYEPLSRQMPTRQDSPYPQLKRRCRSLVRDVSWDKCAEEQAALVVDEGVAGRPGIVANEAFCCLVEAEM